MTLGKAEGKQAYVASSAVVQKVQVGRERVIGKGGRANEQSRGSNAFRMAKKGGERYVGLLMAP